jgi:hypothetical protein
MPLQATSGAASYDAFGGGVPVIPNYIEEVFGTFLYTGNGSTQTITNGIDLAGKGGLVWFKRRNADAFHQLYDTARGVQQTIYTNATNAQTSKPDGLTAFNANGFSVGPEAGVNGSGDSQVSWTFREQSKFFDIVTYTGDGTTPRNISHNLGSVPGCVIVKMLTDSGYSWQVYHRGLTSAAYRVELDSTGAETTSLNPWVSTAPTASVFTVSNSLFVNGSGKQYVAYLFAHNAGGFGLTGTDNVISCGSYVGNGTSVGPTVTLGWEPQWLLIKRASGGTESWYIFDNMRGMPVGSADQYLMPNNSSEEFSFDGVTPTATGFNAASSFNATNANGDTYIYIAIRRGPMKVPTDGTKVFSPFTTAAATGTAVTTNFPVDFQLYKYRAGIDYWFDVDRLRGVNSTTTANSTPWLDTTSTAAEATATNVSRNWGNTGFEVPGIVGGASNVFYSFQRAPGFFDEVCYSPPSTAVNNYSHNLAAVPELMIIKTRDSARRWVVYTQTTGNTQALHLNTADAVNSTGNNYFNSTSPTASVFTLDNNFGDVCNGGGLGVAYLFATCPGVSKVGSYTGTGTTQTINCGFTAGARFVLIKKTSGTGSWYVWDSSRGIVAGNDPYLLLNSMAAEVTNTDYVDTASVGFEISSTAPSEINENGGSFIFLAIA